MATELELSGIPKINSFLLSKKLPLDARTVVQEYAHLNDLVSGNKAYPGMIVYVETDKTHYTYTGTSGTSFTWKKFGTGNLEYDETLQAIKFVFN